MNIVRPEFSGDPTFVLVHGAWQTNETWTPLRDELAQRGYATIAPNLPADEVEATVNDDVQTVADYIGDRDNLFMVVHSRGVEVVPRLLQGTYREQFAGSVILNSGGPHDLKLYSADEVEPPRYQERFAAGIRPFREGLTTYDPDAAAEVFYHDVDDKELVRQAISKLRPQRTLRPGEADLPPLPSQIPVYSVRGSEDKVHNRLRAARLDKEWIGREAYILPGGHILQLSQTKRLADMLIYLAANSRGRYLLAK